MGVKVGMFCGWATFRLVEIEGDFPVRGAALESVLVYGKRKTP
jgi:hypothetical protein